MLEPGARLLMVLDTLPVWPVSPFPDHVHDAIHDGMLSLTDTLVAVLGPALDTVVV